MQKMSNWETKSVVVIDKESLFQGATQRVVFSTGLTVHVYWYPLQRQRKEFDKHTEQLVEQAEKDIKPKMETEQTYKRLELKERQLGELSDAM